MTFGQRQRLGLTTEDIVLADDQLQQVAPLGGGVYTVLVAIGRSLAGPLKPTGEQIDDIRALLLDLLGEVKW